MTGARPRSRVVGVLASGEPWSPAVHAERHACDESPPGAVRRPHDEWPPPGTERRPHNESPPPGAERRA